MTFQFIIISIILTLYFVLIITGRILFKRLIKNGRVNRVAAFSLSVTSMIFLMFSGIHIVNIIVTPPKPVGNIYMSSSAPPAPTNPLKHLDPFAKEENPNNPDFSLVAEFGPLLNGAIAHEIPDTMEVGKPSFAVVRVAHAISDSVLLKGIEPSEKNNFVKDTVVISSRITVLLIDPTDGKNFTISAFNSDEQTLTMKQFLEWRWRILPLVGGEKNELYLRASITVKDEFGKGNQDIPIYEKYVFVKTTVVKTVATFIWSNWAWFIGAIGIPFGSWLFGKIRKIIKTPSHTVAPIGFLPQQQHKKPFWKRRSGN